MINYKKMDELSQNEEFIGKILAANTAEEVQDTFKNEGVEVSLEELEMFREVVNRMMINIQKTGKIELNEDTLENIAGGSKTGDYFKNNWDKIAVGVAALAVTGVAVYGIHSLKKGTLSLEKGIDDATSTLSNELSNLSNNVTNQLNIIGNDLAKTTAKIDTAADSIAATSDSYRNTSIASGVANTIIAPFTTMGSWLRGNGS